MYTRTTMSQRIEKHNFECSFVRSHRAFFSPLIDYVILIQRRLQLPKENKNLGSSYIS